MIYITGDTHGFNDIDKPVLFASDVNYRKVGRLKPFHKAAVSMAVHRLVDFYNAVKIIEIGKFYRNYITFIVKMELIVDFAAVRIAETCKTDNLVACLFGSLNNAIKHGADHRFVDTRRKNSDLSAFYHVTLPVRIKSVSV